MPANSQYHVLLDGQGYLIDLASYKKTVNEPFAPKRRAGDPGYGDLALASVWAQENWSLGFGLDHFTTGVGGQGLGGGAPIPVGYDTGSSIDPHFGDLRLGKNLLSVHNPASVTDLYGLIAYKGKLYSFRADGADVYESSDGSSWAAVHSSNSGRQAAARFNNWLVLGGVDGAAAGVLSKFDSTTWTAAWATYAANTYVRSLAPFRVFATEYLAVGLSNTSAGTSTLKQVNTSGAAVDVTTFTEPIISALIAFDGLLWIATLDDSNGSLQGALYTYDGSRLEPITTLPDNAITSFAEYSGKLYAGSKTRGKIWEVTRQGLPLLWTFPDVEGIGGTSTYAMPILALAVEDGRLHLPVVDTNGLGLYSYDGQGWANLAAGGLGQEPRGLAAFKSDLYLSNKTSAGARTHKAERKSPTTATWISSSFNAGLAATDKLFLKLQLFHAALAAGEAIAVDYEKDTSGVWTNLGTSDLDGATNKSFSFASATTAKSLRLKLTMTLTDQTKTPKVTGLLVHYLVTPDLKAEWTFDVRLEGSAQTPLVRLDNSNEPIAGPALADALWASRAKKQTLSFTDLDAEAKTVQFVHLDERVSPDTQRLGHQTRARVTLVEA